MDSYLKASLGYVGSIVGIMAVIFGTLTITGCAKGSIGIHQTNNSNFTVEFLFEYDGCRVYRFDDNGATHYFTKCVNSSESSTLQNLDKDTNAEDNKTSYTQKH